MQQYKQLKMVISAVEKAIKQYDNLNTRVQQALGGAKDLEDLFVKQVLQSCPGLDSVYYPQTGKFRVRLEDMEGLLSFHRPTSLWLFEDRLLVRLYTGQWRSVSKKELIEYYNKFKKEGHIK